MVDVCNSLKFGCLQCISFRFRRPKGKTYVACVDIVMKPCRRIENLGIYIDSRFKLKVCQNTPCGYTSSKPSLFTMTLYTFFFKKTITQLTSYFLSKIRTPPKKSIFSKFLCPQTTMKKSRHAQRNLKVGTETIVELNGVMGPLYKSMTENKWEIGGVSPL